MIGLFATTTFTVKQNNVGLKSGNDDIERQCCFKNFFSSPRLEKMKEVKIPCAVYSASLLKENKIFVCGGEDLKLYKYNYETGEEIGEGHGQN